jgi:hypothetical protein
VIACPGPLEVAGTARGAVVEYRVVAAARCGEVRLACDPPSGSMFPPGTTEVNCVAENEAGVTSRCSFEVTVREGDSFSFLRGDCNGDGEVVGTVTDAVFLLQFNFLGGPEPLCLAACDANGDGEVGGVVTDAVYVLAFNFLGGRSPVDPFPACGASSSAADAALGCESPPQSCR